MDDSASDELAGATGLALAVIVALIERNEPIPKAEVARCLSKLAEAADPAAVAQRRLFASWAQMMAGPGAGH